MLPIYPDGVQGLEFAFINDWNQLFTGVLQKHTF